tara:strand:+ start:67 stop:486 length:420 start_codon:yes stop_codon:yes gene_type:complete
MPMKQQGRTIYKSMQGKQIDMDLLRQRNELTPAVGNAQVNARGDELGPGGKIIRKKEDVLKDYYENSSSMPEEIAVKRAPKQEAAPETVTEKKTKTRTATPKISDVASVVPEGKDLTDDWVEDDDGNFVKPEDLAKKED